MKSPIGLLTLTVLGLAAVGALWGVGLVGVLSPPWMGGLLATSVLTGVAILIGTRLARDLGRKGRSFTYLAGLVTLAGGVVFPLELFTLMSGAVPVTPGNELLNPPVERLRIVDWNVLHGYPELRRQEARFELQLAALRALDPTVIVLQEAWSTTRHGSLVERLGAELGMSHVYARANGSRRLLGFEEGSAILSRLPIVRARRVVLRPRKVPWRARIALLATLALGRGEELSVVGTHLTNLDVGVAAAQARDLAVQLPDTGFLIVAGDLNADSTSGAAQAFVERGLVDVVPGGIDHVFLTGSSALWRVAHADRTLRPQDLVSLLGKSARLSDHPGIVIDLVRSVAPGAGTSVSLNGVVRDARPTPIVGD